VTTLQSALKSSLAQLGYSRVVSFVDHTDDHLSVSYHHNCIFSGVAIRQVLYKCYR